MPHLKVFDFSNIELIDGIPHKFNGETSTPVPSVRILWHGHDRTVYYVGNRLISLPELRHTLDSMGTNNPAWITSHMPKHAFELLNMLSEGYGITDIAHTLKTSPTYLYRVLITLQTEGVSPAAAAATAAAAAAGSLGVKSFEDIKALLDEGKSVANVASTLKVSKGCIYARIRKSASDAAAAGMAGATLPKKRQAAARMEQVRALLAEGMSGYAIAKTFGISHQRVYQIAQILDKKKDV